jgi:hypothetical protein
VEREFQVVFIEPEARDACAVSLISTKTATDSWVRPGTCISCNEYKRSL